MAPHHPLRDYGMLLALAVIWGGSFSLIKLAVVEVPPLTIAAGRIAIAAIVLAIAARVAGQHLPRPGTPGGLRAWGHFAAVGMLGNGIPFSLISWGEIEVSSSLAAILIGVMPVFTATLARLTGIEHRIGGRRIAGIVVGFGALVVLMGPAALGEMGKGAVLAQAAIAAAAACYAANGVYAKRLSFSMPILTLAAGSMIASAAFMVPVALAIEAPWHLAPSWGALAAVSALGLFATALAAIIYIRLLVSAGPTFASMINYLIPAFGTLVGILWLNETLGAREATALALILAAIALVRTEPARAVTPSVS